MLFFHGKTFNILFCWSRYIFQNYKGNTFSPSRGKNRQMNESQYYVIRVLPMAFIPWIVQPHEVFLFLVGKTQCFLTSKHAARIFTNTQCRFKTNMRKPAGRLLSFVSKTLLRKLITLYTMLKVWLRKP